jgi:hypothetical protein
MLDRCAESGVLTPLVLCAVTFCSIPREACVRRKCLPISRVPDGCYSHQLCLGFHTCGIGSLVALLASLHVPHTGRLQPSV